ncbi:MAG: FKBP-type peptidyl-prolyl cis-trans isomerase [Chromatiales bacterium]|nr:MAG: FKBP-type peptidyl-prolyl cis-trans isomerase [Chromatiales bacterium]
MFRPLRKFNYVSLFVFATLVAPQGMAQETPEMIAEGKQVSFTYTLTSEGDVVESNSGQEPMVYIQGGGQILPALEAELEGMSAGQEKSVSLTAANAYGEVRQDAFQEIPLDQLPEGARVQGAMLQAQGFPGPIRVSEIKEEVAVLDFNHPLAGKDITFDILIVGVEARPPAPSITPAPAE